MSSSYACRHCSKVFTSAQAVNSHARTHSPNWEASRQRQRKSHAKQSASFREAFATKELRCTHCDELLPFEHSRSIAPNQFCDNGCAAAYSNRGRTARTAQAKAKLADLLVTRTKAKRKEALAKTVTALFDGSGGTTALSLHQRLRAFDVSGPFSKLVACTCLHCGVRWQARTWRKYCSDHAAAYSAVSRKGYLFAFNPFQYPDIFDAATLTWCKTVGVYARANRGGWTRDHKVSVNEAIRMGYDVFYIRHPLNCELMSFDKNNSKKARSSMSYEELVRQVNAYEAAKVLAA